MTDPLPDGATADDLRRLVNQAEPPAPAVGQTTEAPAGQTSQWPPLDMGLLQATAVAPPAFDWGFVPPGWADYIQGVAQDRGTPPDYVFAAALVACATALGNSRRAHPWADWFEPAHLWVAVVGHPSSGKTPAITPLLDGLKRLEADELDAFAPIRLEHARAVEVAKATAERWEKDVKDAIKNNTPAPDKPAAAEPPDGISPPRLVVNDTTIEALCPILSGNPRGTLIYRDELAGWIASFDRYTNGAGGDRAFYLEAWNGASYTVDRKSLPKPLHIRSAAVGIIGGIQPDRLRDVLAGSDDGMIARFVYVWPEALPPRRPQGGNAWMARQEFLDRALTRLRSVPMADGPHGPEPVALPVTEAGLCILDAIRSEVMASTKADSAIMAGWCGKNPGRLLRLALTFNFMGWAAGDSDTPPAIISHHAMAAAADYLDYCAAMMGRVLGELAQSRAERDATRLARLILNERLTRINERDLSRSPGFSDLRDHDRRAAALAELEAAGWVRRIQRPSGAGRKPGDWAVNPATSKVQ